MTMRSGLGVFVLLVGLLIPAASLAQSAIAGVVTDTTGGALPGVTVEARSPALIEQVKSTVTDGQGQYRVVDLRPGTYAITFTLAGFSTFVRDEIDLAGGFTANINIQLTVGGIEETVTVTGETPVVDVRTTQRREVLSREVMDALPTGRNYTTIAKGIPAIAAGATDVGGSSFSEVRGGIRAYGGDGEEIFQDGMSMAPGQGAGHSTVHFYNHGAYSEVVYEVNGGSAATQTGGVQVNLIPKEGGNTLSGSGVAVYGNHSMQSGNASTEQLAAGLGVDPGIDTLFDYNVSLGGPMIRDRLWFFTSHRWWAANNRLAKVHDGLEGPVGEQVVDNNLDTSYLLRLTAQVTSTNKFSIYYEDSRRREYFNNIGRGRRTRPEATGIAVPNLSYMAQVKWTSTPTNRLLLSAGWGSNYRGYQGKYQKSVLSPSEFPPFGTVSKIEESTGSRYSSITNRWFNPFYRDSTEASLTYATGAHDFRTGVQVGHGYQRNQADSQGDIVQEYNFGVPIGVQALATPSNAQANIDYDIGVYFQDSWTTNRLTLTPGLRIDKFVGSIPPQEADAGRWLPRRVFPEFNDLPNWTDVSARFGAAYDLFGDGTTVLKGSAGKYMATEAVGFPIRYNPMLAYAAVANVGDSRDWTDTNGDDIAQDSEIGPSRNPAFGGRRTNNVDPDITRGYDLLYNLTFERELRPNLAVAISYNRRDIRNLRFTNNLAYERSEYQELTIADPRGTGTLPVFQINPAVVGRPTNNFDTNSDLNIRGYNGFDVVVHGSFDNGMTFQGGTSTGRIVSSTCELEDPSGLGSRGTGPAERFCDQGDFDVPLRTNFKGFATYPLPWDLNLATVFQSVAGAERIATYLVTRALLPAMTSRSSAYIRLNEPGSSYFDRINTVDFSITRTLRVDRYILKPAFEVFNMFNANPATVENNRFPFVASPTAILQGRFVRVAVQVDF